MAKDVRRALMIASEPLKVPSTYASMDPDARAAWKTDQMAREGHGSFSPPGTPEREENFNRWHGNSKIRDGEGNPLRLYHATPKSFDTFLPGGPNPANEMPSGPATWLSPYPDKQPAGHHVGGFEDRYKSGANVMPVHADIRNPLVIDNKTMRDWARQSYAKGSGEFPLLVSPESRKMLLEDGYDGILWAGFDATSKDEAFYDDHGIGEHPSKDEEIIALHPPGRAQIKSAIGNRGQYDPEDTHVNYARGGDVGAKRALMIARDQRALLRRIANIYPGPGGGMDPSPGGGGYSGPGGGKYIGPSRYAEGGSVPPFKLHSGAAKIIGAKGQKKATPQQYAAMPGIKPDELKHSKFDTLGTKALPREEVIKHLEDNAVPLQETVLGDGDFDHGEAKSTKFADETLPGGQNYREVLLHLPDAGAEDFQKRHAAAKKAKADTFEHVKNMMDLHGYGDHPELLAAQQAYVDANKDFSKLQGEITERESTRYRSGHWEQPNVVAHVRMSDRVGPNGETILHLEEAQSDWGQQGRDQGFKGSPLTEQEGARLQELSNAGARDSKHPLHAEWTELGTRFNASRDGLPSGPYVDNTQKWTDLALKRVLHEAAHGGYDKIVVTPGDEQNKRYDLSSQVRNISYFPDIGYLNAETHDGEGLDEHDVKPGDLAKHIGKEAADRILKQGMQRYEGRGKLGGEFYHELEGDGLKMGGAGMRGYYDNILPKRLQALAQQHDPQAKVNLHAHPLKDFYVKQSPGYQGNDFEAFTPDDASLGAHPTREAAEIAIAQRRATPGNETAPLHSLDVTPQMRDSIKGNGFNSFKRGGDVDVAKKPPTPTIKKTLDLRPAETFPDLATRYPETAPPEWAHDPKKKVDYLAKRLSPEALAVQTAKKVIQKDIEEGRYKPYFDPLKRYDASSSEFGVKAPTTGIKKVKPETQVKYEAHARSPEAIQRLSGAFERGMLQPREASDWYLMGQLHNEYVAKHGPKIGSRLFKERFADAMSATTGGADPTSNFLTSHYGNYVKAHKQQFPEKSYDLPFPIGGRYIGGNIDQFNKMIMQGKGVTPANPKRYNFSHNFLGDASGSTIDEQMSGLYDPKMSVPPEGTYGHYEGALADLAKKTKGAKSPRHFQEVAWAGAKDIGTKGGYRASPMISHINQSIERTSRLTGLSPDEVVAQNLVDVKGPMFKKGGRVGKAHGGGIAQLQQNLQGAFSDLNRQVAAQAPQQQQAMPQQAPYGAYQRMDAQARGDAPNDASRALMYNALNGKTYEGLFPKAATPAAPTAPAPAAPAAPDPVPVDTASPQTPNYSDMLQGGDGGAGFKRGGRTKTPAKSRSIVEHALAVTRRK